MTRKSAGKTRNAAKAADKYKFKHFGNYREKALVCPSCFEIMMRDDIEAYTKCPFCNSSLEMNSQLEDYILNPVIEHWICSQGASLPEIYIHSDSPGN